MGTSGTDSERTRYVIHILLQCALVGSNADGRSCEQFGKKNEEQCRLPEAEIAKPSARIIVSRKEHGERNKGKQRSCVQTARKSGMQTRWGERRRSSTRFLRQR